MRTAHITIEGIEYEVRSLTIGQMLTLIPKFNADGQDSVEAQKELLMTAVYKDGQPLGEKVLDFPSEYLLPLQTKVFEVNPIGGDSEGND